jgi:signal transduction histidine kinase
MILENRILASFRAGILAIDLGGTVTFVNEIGSKILKNFPVAVGDSLRGRVGENPLFRMLVGAIDLVYLPTRLEVELPDPERPPRSIGFTLAELKEEGVRTGICAFFKDLTHVEMAEENRDLDERLRLLGQMAAGLAHEIRNPIASVGVHCGLLRSRYQGDPKIQSSVALMEREIGKVENIIRECLNFVRPAELGIRPVPVSVFLERLLTQWRKLYGGVRFDVAGGGSGTLEVEMDEVLMEQALANIVANAAQACGGDGHVTVSAGITKGFWELESDPREPMLPALGDREDFLVLSVKDDGPGIPEEIRDKIFVPFFTTKKEGTGIGLPLVQKIIYAHKGVLDIVSEPGKGTEFIIRIPVRHARGG